MMLLRKKPTPVLEHTKTNSHHFPVGKLTDTWKALNYSIPVLAIRENLDSDHFLGGVKHIWSECFRFALALCNKLQLSRLKRRANFQNGDIVLGQNS